MSTNTFAAKNDDIAFTKVKLPYGWMGNMAPYPVNHEGIRYWTTEALFQALRFSEDDPIREELSQFKNPMEAKFYAKKFADRMVIEQRGDKDVENMLLCLRLKFDQHNGIRSELLETGERTLIEDTTNRKNRPDMFWGARKEDGVWEGLNTLGELLMWVREDIKASRY